MSFICKFISGIVCSFLLFLAASTFVSASQSLYYIHSDQLGSTSIVTDSNGEIVSKESYYPFGETRGEWTNIDHQVTERAYTGQISDQDQTGLYYYNARYYNPQISKFTQADTISDGLNRYAYVGNNPINRTDPTGHMWSEGEAGGGGTNVPACNTEDYGCRHGDDSEEGKDYPDKPFNLLFIGGKGADLDIKIWREWIMAYEGWTSNYKWDVLHTSFLDVVGGQVEKYRGSMEEVNELLESYSIRVFLWGEDRYDQILKMSEGAQVSEFYQYLNQDIKSLGENVVVVSFSKGANLLMKYMEVSEYDLTLTRPDKLVLIAPPSRFIGKFYTSVVGIAGADFEANWANQGDVAQLCAHNDVVCTDRYIKDAVVFNEGLEGHNPQGKVAKKVLESISVPPLSVERVYYLPIAPN